MIDRLLRANRTVILMPVIDGPNEPLLVGVNGSLVPFSAPTSTLINGWASIVTTTPAAASNGGNISCALLDDLTLGMAESDTDDELTICSIGNESTPTFYNVDASLVILRDRNKSDTGVFNLATQLLNSKGRRFVALDRLDGASTKPFSVGDTVSLFDLVTDNPVDVKEDRGNLKLQQTPKSSGLLNNLYTLTA
jgi:hypothetical protein